MMTVWHSRHMAVSGLRVRLGALVLVALMALLS